MIDVNVAFWPLFYYFDIQLLQEVSFVQLVQVGKIVVKCWEIRQIYPLAVECFVLTFSLKCTSALLKS